MSGMSRREFLVVGAVTTVGVASYPLLRNLQAIETVDNPLDVYPFRGWEQVYRDQYAYDSSFTFICSPNDTHACRLRAFTRNGVIQRLEQNYDVGRYADQSTAHTGSSSPWSERVGRSGPTMASPSSRRRTGIPTHSPAVAPTPSPG